MEIQINLSVHTFADEKHTFATVTDFGSFLFEQEQKNELGNRLHRAIDASEDGIWEWNIPNNKVWYSPRLMFLIGKEHKDQAQLDDWLEHIHPEDVPKVNEALDSHFLEKTKFDINYRGKTASGSYEWFRTRGDSIFDQHGQAILMSGILSNINDTKLLENQLAEKSRFLNEVLQRSLTGLYIFDLHQQQISFINPEYTNLTGYSFEALNHIQNNNGYKNLYHPNDQAQIKAHQEALLKYGSDEGQGIEFRFKHHSGEWKWIYLRESVYSFSQDGVPKELLGAFFDISELKQREYEIRKLALDYFTTFEQAGVGIAHINLDGSFIKANSKFLEIFNYKHLGEISGTFTSLCDEIDRDKLSILIKHLIQSDETVFNVEKKFTRSGKEIFWADLTVSHIKPINTDVPAYFIVILQDISERKLMEQNLSESNLALERFAYSASHDLQEPLRKISAFSGSLERRLKEITQDPEILFQLERICDASVRMGKMIDNLLKLSRANSDALKITETSLSAVLIQTLDDISQKTKPIEIKLILKKDAMIAVDLNAFGQVIRNLIVNSIVYRGKASPLIIEINTEIHEKFISIKYQDNGIGISDDKLEVIFEPFSRLVSKDIPGTGMGLTICKQVIKAHKGRIYAVSDHDPGATFIIDIPKIQGL